jgi:hypothetical protein
MPKWVVTLCSILGWLIVAYVVFIWGIYSLNN